MSLNKPLLVPAAFVLAMAFAAFPQTLPAAKHHVVFQMNDAEGPAWQSLATHVSNMRKAFAQDGGSQVEVVFFGPGLGMLLKTNTGYTERLKLLAEGGVILSACQNSMRDRGVRTEDLFPFATQVDSGIAELARKQEAGWAYIH